MKDFPKGNMFSTVTSMRLLKVQRSSLDLFQSFMTLPLYRPPPPLAASQLLSYANRWAIVWAKQPGIPLTKGKWRWKERGEKGTDKSGLMHITDPKHRPKTDPLREYKEPDGGFLLQCALVCYATLANFMY